MPNYPLFSVMGLEIEYMLVDRDSLDLCPKSDWLLQHIAGEVVNEVELSNEMSVSNELVLHVIEVKNAPPQAPDLHTFTTHFQKTINQLQQHLNTKNMCLLPTASHPWMNPLTDTKRWIHGHREIYQTFDQIFDCRGHGWSNLQSMHVNLPFANDDEFNRLHNAIRLLLPLLPALAASSPILDGKPTGFLDTRLHYYNHNQEKLPLNSGDIIPEFVTSEAGYLSNILEPMYTAIRPFDPDHVLQFEWLNSRGAIPKFAYHAIEIRLLDTQECVSADLAIAFLMFEVLKAWCDHSDTYLTTPCDTQKLKTLYLSTLKMGLNAPITDPTLLMHMQLPTHLKDCRAVWEALIEKHAARLDPASQKHLARILSHGNLSERILKATGREPSKQQLRAVYGELADALKHNTFYYPT